MKVSETSPGENKSFRQESWRKLKFEAQVLEKIKVSDISPGENKSFRHKSWRK